jgi:hypothetical protein
MIALKEESLQNVDQYLCVVLNFSWRGAIAEETSACRTARISNVVKMRI